MSYTSGKAYAAQGGHVQRLSLAVHYGARAFTDSWLNRGYRRSFECIALTFAFK